MATSRPRKKKTVGKASSRGGVRKKPASKGSEGWTPRSKTRTGAKAGEKKTPGKTASKTRKPTSKRPVKERASSKKKPREGKPAPKPSSRKKTKSPALASAVGVQGLLAGKKGKEPPGTGSKKAQVLPVPRGLRGRSQPVEVQEIDVRVARDKKSRLPGFLPRSYGRGPRKADPRLVIEALNKFLGKNPVPRTLPSTVVELGIFCIFAIGGCSARVAETATKRLVKAFPDWNEFRVSDAFEFVEILEDLRIPELFDRCEQILDFINEVYQDQNGVDLEFLREKTPPERLNLLNRYISLGPPLALYLALGLQDFKGLLFHYSWARVVQRTGLVPRSGSPNTLLGSMSRIFKDPEALSSQVNLVLLGEEVCHSKNPQCKSCYLVMFCKDRKI